MDYSRLNNISLLRSGVISDSSIELKEFLAANNIVSVGMFLRKIDESFFSTAPYKSTLMEARGIADILKNKYFNVMMISDVLLDKPIIDIDFELPVGTITMPGIRRGVGKVMDIYNAITRLGFNDKERSMILSWNDGKVYDMCLIDIFDGICSNSQLFLGDDAFSNKILYYVSYYKRKNNLSSISEMHQNEFVGMLSDLSDMESRMDKLAKQVERLQEQMALLGTQIEEKKAGIADYRKKHGCK